MKTDDFPVRDFAGLCELEAQGEVVVLCPDAGFAAGVRAAYARFRQTRGTGPWVALATATPEQWLGHLLASAMLRGELDPASCPATVLTPAQESAIWRQVVTDAVTQEGDAALLDPAALARTAAAAFQLEQRWRLQVPAGWPDAEYQAYLLWRQGFLRRCKDLDAVDATAAHRLRLQLLRRGAGALPAHVLISGWLHADPLLEELLDILRERGVGLYKSAPGRWTSGEECQHPAEDADAEHLAAALWASRTLKALPTARLCIVVADLDSRRTALARALDDVLGLSPDSSSPCWGFARGERLANLPVVALALRLLRLAFQPQLVEQAEFGALIRSPGWGGGAGEADAAALWEADLRRQMPPAAALGRYLAALQSSRWNERLPLAAKALTALHEVGTRRGRRQMPGAWTAQFGELLAAARWANDSDQPDADAFIDALEELGALDGVSGRIDGTTALGLVADACRRRMPGRGAGASAGVIVASIDDLPVGEFDGVWIIGANDHLLPSAPEPNALLPAAIQRAAGIPAACPRTRQQVAARQREWLRHAAPTIVWSWSAREGERRLRPAAEIAALPVLAFDPNPDPSSPACLAMELIEDHQGLPVGPDESVRGGTWLLRAQSICPAWGYFRYRLGIEGLESPRQPLDARDRGEVLHTTLEIVWRGRSAEAVRQWSEMQRGEVLADAVEQALQRLEQDRGYSLSPALRRLEARRLIRLVGRWLLLEFRRPDFQVVACEDAHELVVEGLPVRVVVDRIDRLADGRLVILDYKSGSSASSRSWIEARISEPQLPVYAALVFPDGELAAVAIARVVAKDAGFSGVAAEDGILPSLKGIDSDRRRYPEERFPDMAALRRHWAGALRDVAQEIGAGVAAVQFEDPALLDYCEVRPLLRLGDRLAQWQELP